MPFPYTCRLTSEIQQQLVEVKALRQAALLLPQPSTPVLEKLRSASQLKSSVYSARIEGNPLDVQSVNNLRQTASNHNAFKQEILNLNEALTWIYTQPQPLQLSLILAKKLHSLCLNGIGPESGALRVEPSAVFNQAGVAVYLAPPPEKVKAKLQVLFEYLNSSSDEPLIPTVVAHYAFEKIHPFLDGNGRVGRLLLTVGLRNLGYDLHGLLDLNHYFELHRQTYYDLLLVNKSDVTDFTSFMLEGIRQQTQLAFQHLHAKPQKERPEDQLLPRRQEILAIIRDHQMITFDFVARRFAAVPKSTLHNDLRQLINQGFVKKLGSTRGVLYSKA